MSATPFGAWATSLLATHPRQPDQRSCGASVLVVERALRDEDYARWLTEDASRFGSEALGTHGRTTRAVTAAGRLQLPWPRALGTPPWAVAGELTASTGRRWGFRTILRREPAWEALVAAVEAGSPSPLYVGSRWIPRHVVLTVGASDTAIQCYEPGSGRVLSVTREAFLDATFRLAGWTKPWFVVVPA
ncbi:hypothetical protein [Nocardioides bigeumensis]|uniref:Peptidase C39-like domain-containing protein n=1 Tax=Nocardioides bigeumensis TaxID=433657 RepID=A0ABN2YLZ6_9ACTN